MVLGIRGLVHSDATWQRLGLVTSRDGSHYLVILGQLKTGVQMHINRIAEEVLSQDAVELLNVLAVHAVATADMQAASLCYLPVEADAWNATMHLMREIFEAEIVTSDCPSAYCKLLASRMDR